MDEVDKSIAKKNCRENWRITVGGRSELGPAYYIWRGQEEWRPCEWDHNWEFHRPYMRRSTVASTTQSCQARSGLEWRSSSRTKIVLQFHLQKVAILVKTSLKCWPFSQELGFWMMRKKSRGSLGWEIVENYRRTPWQYGHTDVGRGGDNGESSPMENRSPYRFLSPKLLTERYFRFNWVNPFSALYTASLNEMNLNYENATSPCTNFRVPKRHKTWKPQLRVNNVVVLSFRSRLAGGLGGE